MKPGTPADRARPRRVVDAAQRHDLHLQAPPGGALAHQAAGQRARADGRGRQVHLRALPGAARATPIAASSSRWSKIEVVDKYTVKFTLKEPFAWFLEAARLDLHLDHRQGGGGAVRGPQEAGELHRDGPVDARALRAQLRLTFVRNPNYFVPGLPYVDGVDMTIDTDPASAFAAWLAGRYDFGPEYGMVVRRSDLRRPSSASRDCRRRTTPWSSGALPGSSSTRSRSRTCACGAPSPPPATGRRSSRPTPGPRADRRAQSRRARRAQGLVHPHRPASRARDGSSTSSTRAKRRSSSPRPASPTATRPPWRPRPATVPTTWTRWR